MRLLWKPRRNTHSKGSVGGRRVLDYATKEKSEEGRDDEDLSDEDVPKELLQHVMVYIAIGIITFALVFLSFFCD